MTSKTAKLGSLLKKKKKKMGRPYIDATKIILFSVNISASKVDALRFFVVARLKICLRHAGNSLSIDFYAIFAFKTMGIFTYETDFCQYNDVMKW